MKKLFITVILAIVCQFTFAQRGYRHHGEGYYGHGGYGGYCAPHPCYAPPVVVIAPRPCVHIYHDYNRRIWIEGHWIITPRGYEQWIPPHWSY